MLIPNYRKGGCVVPEKNVTKVSWDGLTDGRTDGRTDGLTDRGKTVYPPFFKSRGIIKPAPLTYKS